jgi:PAT family beta-lactamase induction signal transducer AmpG
MGLSNSTYGLLSGFIAYCLPQLLAERHVPVAKVAAITATVLSPTAFSVVFSPILDVRFSRRWYATVLACAAGIFLALAVANIRHLAVLEAAMLLANVAAFLSGSALGGWLSTIVATEDESRISSWFNIANVGGAGLMFLLGAEILRLLPLHVAAAVIGLLLFLPTGVFPFMPAPGPDRKLASESFAQFFREVLALLRRKQVLIALLLFVAPSASFSLTAMLSGFGDDFHASARMVSLLGGLGVVAAATLGSLLFPSLARRMPLRPLYLGIGTVGGLFTLSLIAMPHTPATFTTALVGENVFQALAYTACYAIAFETIGRDNPLAATTFTVLNAAANIPILYMLVIDGNAYTHHGVVGSFAADAGVSIAACALLGCLLWWLRPRENLS